MTNAGHYETLKIENTASAEEIKRAYYKLVRQFPPERFPEEFVAFKEAYETLSDATRRENYDADLKRQTKQAGDLPPEALSLIEQAKTEIQKAHTGKAVTIAEDLYAKYPENAAVIKLLQEAYLARGWKNKAAELMLVPAYQKMLKTAHEWDLYCYALVLRGFSQPQISAKTIEKMAELAETGEDDIGICAQAYHDFCDDGDKITDFAFPEKFDNPDKILNHILELSGRGLKAADPETFISWMLAPTIIDKSPSELDDRDIARLRTILEIVYGAVEEHTVKKSEFYAIIKGIEYIIEQNSEPEYQLEPVRSGEKIGRNDPCPCGSGKKYKKCCGR